jgi:hypothetical protein
MKEAGVSILVVDLTGTAEDLQQVTARGGSHGTVVAVKRPTEPFYPGVRRYNRVVGTMEEAVSDGRQNGQKPPFD